MKERYTTKKYDASKKINFNIIEELKQILHLAPSSINSQPWKFHFVSDEKIKNELAKVSYFNTEKVINCDTVVVFNVYNDITLFEEQIKKHLPEGAFNYYLTYIKPLPEAEIKAWMSKQVYLALGVFLIACAQLQIDATPMEGIEIDKYDAILNQENYTALVAVAIGYRDQEDANQPDRKPKSRLPIDQIIETI